jgi:putative transposase
VQWKSSAIKVESGKLRLSNGKGNKPLVIPWVWDTPVWVEIGWDGRQYELRACYKLSDARPKEEREKGGVAGVDLSEVHLAVAHDGENTYIANGRLLRSKRRYQNKLKARLSRLIDRKKRGSRRHRQLLRSKRKQLARLNRQIRDILHKQTTRLVSTLCARGVQTVVIGDIRNIRVSAARVSGTESFYGQKANQKIHQMVHGQARHYITYKAERLGMRVVLQDERYSSQTCPACNKRNKPQGPGHRCGCGFRFHRDGVGAVNLRRTYLGLGPVVGVMASPIGLRFQPHALSPTAARSAL